MKVEVEAGVLHPNCSPKCWSLGTKVVGGRVLIEITHHVDPSVFEEKKPSIELTLLDSSFSFVAEFFEYLKFS
jgi:hypothetical protein